MEKKKRIIRENSASMNSKMWNDPSDNIECGGIIHLNEPVEEYARKHGFISLEESWRRINNRICEAENEHGIR